MKKRGIIAGRSFAVLLIFLVTSFTLYCQVKIKEKVEIKPGLKTTQDLKKLNNGNTVNSLPCNAHFEHDTINYYQVVWEGYWGSLDPAQQLFNLQSNLRGTKFFTDWGPLNVEIIAGQQNCKLQKLVLDTECEIDNCWKWVDLNSNTITNTSYFYLRGGEPDGYRREHGDTICTIYTLNGIEHLTPEYYRIVYGYYGTGNVTYKIACSSNSGHYLLLHTTILTRHFYMTGNQTDQLEHGHEFGLGITPATDQCANNEFEAGGWIPDDTRFNVEITEGAEYGELKFENTRNNQTGIYFTDVTEGDIACLNFIPNGCVPDTAGIVKIYITSSGAGIAPLELRLRIVPNFSDDYPVRVRLNPSQISPGDTANIILERRNFDGSYSTFDAGQTFNIELVKGENYGTLLCENDTSDYFYGLEQPFKFIASKDINADSVAAWIKVTTMISSEQMSNSSIKKENTTIKNKLINAKRTKFINDALPIYKNKKEESNTETTNETLTINKPSIITKKKKVTAPKTNLIIIGGGDEEIFGWGKAVIKKKDCSNLPKCSTQPIVPVIVIEEQRKGFAGIDSCDSPQKPAGFHSPLPASNYLNDFTIETCYNESTDNVQFSVQGGIISLNSIVDVCLQNIIDKGLEPVTIIEQIPSLDPCRAWISFNAQLNGEKIYKGYYHIVDADWAHERVHKDNFLIAANKIFENHKSKLQNYFKKCSAYFNLNYEKDTAKEEFEGIIFNFRDDVLNKWNNERKKPNFESETNKNPSIKDVLTNYINFLITSYPDFDFDKYCK